MTTRSAEPPSPGQILPTYARGAAIFAHARGKSLWERPMLHEIAARARGPRVLDIGCGPGDPLGLWLARRGFRLTGLDGAAEMLALYRRTVPGALTQQADMRHMALRQRFDVLLAWDSFFHLDWSAQARMFPTFAAHAAPGALLVFSSGPARSVSYGHAAGAPVFHASHSPLCYRLMLVRAGFEVVLFKPEDPKLDRHTWWVCRRA